MMAELNHCPSCNCETCDVCGETADGWTIDVMHRGCRLAEAFPDAVTSEKDLIAIELAKIPWPTPKPTNCRKCGGSGNSECKRCRSTGQCHGCCVESLANQRQAYAEYAAAKDAARRSVAGDPA